MKTAARVERKARIAGLRKFPYPFEAAFTILSDRHGITDSAEFLAFHRFLNTSQETPHGPGLDLEIGDTFWFYDDEQKFSYFKGYTNTPSDQAGLIREFVASGYIDGLHTYGDFTHHPFERKYAEWAVEEMDRHNIDPRVWVNHGDRNNIQNINRGLSYHLGANRSSLAYHMDLTLRAGFKFFWRYLTPFNGQDRPLTPFEFCSPAKFESKRKALFATKRTVKYLLASADRMFGSPTGFYDDYADNHLLQFFEVDDGSRLMEFRRFNNHPDGIWRGARVADLKYQLQPEILDRLVASKGFMLVYNHLEYGDFYAPEIVSLLRRLSDRALGGEVWVTTAQRMLKYNLLYHLLRWEESLDGNVNLTITIAEQLENPPLGKESVSTDDLQGINFEISNKYTPRFYLGDTEIALSCLSKGTTSSIYGVPMTRLPYPAT